MCYVTTVPSAPVGLNVTALNSSAILISWQSPAEWQRHGVITGYMVTYVATVSRVKPVKFSVLANEKEKEPFSAPSNYQVTVTDLSPNTAYEVAVQAVTRKGDGSSARSKVRTPPGAPEPPRSLVLSALPASDGAADCVVRATWTPPASMHGAALRSYSVTYWLSESDAEAEANSTEQLATFLELPLDCGVWLHVALSARTQYGQSALVNRSLRVPERAPSAAPETLAFAALSNSSGNLSWHAPPWRFRGARTLSYLLLCYGSHSFEHRENTTQCFALLSRLQPNAQYHCQLRAASSAGSGPSVNLSFVFTGEREYFGPVPMFVFLCFPSSFLLLLFMVIVTFHLPVFLCFVLHLHALHAFALHSSHRFPRSHLHVCHCTFLYYYTRLLLITLDYTQLILNYY